jgi:hypothetical protein
VDGHEHDFLPMGVTHPQPNPNQVGYGCGYSKLSYVSSLSPTQWPTCTMQPSDALPLTLASKTKANETLLLSLTGLVVGIMTV